MNRVFAAALAVAALVPATAVAQTTQSSASEPMVNIGYIGVHGGVAVVEKFGGAYGVEAGIRIWKSLDIVGEFAMLENVVTRRILENASTIATALGTTQGKAASGSVEMPASYAGVGARYVFEQAGRFRPYILVTVGGIRTERKPTFTLDGANVTGNIEQYGITLGQDLIGKENQLGVSGGAGLVLGIGSSFYLDAGVRLISIGGDARTNASRLVIGGGYRF